MINIPITGGITEGGAIIIAIVLTILALVVFCIVFLWKYGNDFRKVLVSVKQDSTITKEHTANHHDKNLREDLDEKDRVQNEKLDKILEIVNGRFDRMNDRITGLDRRMTGYDARINNMERYNE